MTDNPVPKKNTRERILDAAQQLFIEQGFNGTSMSDIAKRAKVNQSLIHHHFDTKEKLWKTVRDKVLDQYVTTFEDQRISQDDFNGGIKEFIEKRFKFLQSNPQVARMLDWLNVANFTEDQDDSYTASHTQARLKSFVSNFKSDIEQAQARGIIRSDIDAQALMVMMMSLTASWFQNNNQWLLQAQVEQNDEQASRYLDNVKDLLVKAIAA